MKIAHILAALTLTATPALAENITLTSPMAGATVHEGGLDLNVYWVPVEGGTEVVATYTSRVDAYAPGRIRMLMQDGDTVAFGVPGVQHVLYTFERTGDSLSVTASDTGLQYASN